MRGMIDIASSQKLCLEYDKQWPILMNFAGPLDIGTPIFDPFQVDIRQSPKISGGAELCPEGDSIAVTADNAPWAMWCGRIFAESCDVFFENFGEASDKMLLCELCCNAKQ